MSGAGFYGAKVRTQRDKSIDCHLFIANASPAALLAMTAEKLCQDKGVTDRKARQEVEIRLLTAQSRERQRA